PASNADALHGQAPTPPVQSPKAPPPAEKAPAPWDGTKGLGYDNAKTAPPQTSAPRTPQQQAQALKEAVTQAFQTSATVVQNGLKELKQGFGTLLEKVGLQQRLPEHKPPSLEHAEGGEAVHKHDDVHEARGRSSAAGSAPSERANTAER